MIENSFPIAAMPIPSLDDLTRQLHIIRPALIGKRACEHIVDLHEGVALRTPGFG